ncbi:rhomboid-like protein [Nocardia spumae]|uniref:rhomboid-like protein n=1 Tax=Nocardia spumae TaxID=2887190 RepID=UPI001D15DA90|nr:rhomboid-like protein [Nocardia spumae]
MPSRGTARWTSVPSAVGTYIRRAPGTYMWLAILLVSTLVVRHLTPQQADIVLGNRSTNLHHLREDPVRVLISSAFWLAGGGWLGYAVSYTVFHAQAERWLGTLRWLIVVLIAHVGATYISEGVLYWAIHHDYAPESAVNTLDYGVSYALAGVVAVLVYRIATPWRYLYLVGVIIFYTVPVFAGRTFTDIGHFSAMTLGFACYPLTRGRPGPWDPVAATRARFGSSARG